MRFELEEEQKLVLKTAEDFARKLRERMRDYEREGVPPEIREEYRKLGLGLCDIPESFGGYNLGLVTKALVLEKLAWGCAGVTLALELENIFLQLLASCEGDTKHLSELKNERPAIWIDLDGVFTREGGVWRGEAPAVPGKGPTLFCLVKDGEVHFFRKFQATDVKPLALDACGVCEVKVEGEADESLKINQKRFLSVLRIYVSALLAGVLRASFEYASAYAQERVVFGKPVAHHQGMAWVLADFSTSVSACELYLIKSAWALDRGKEDYFRVCADAFVFIAEKAVEYTVWGVQVLGGHGFVKDHPVEKWMREAKALSLLWGGVTWAELHSEEFL